MTTTFFLVRHAAHDRLGTYLAGRGVDVELGEDGQAQAQQLAARMRGEQFAAIHASPRRRTRQTAAAIGAAVGRIQQAFDDLDEIDFGDAWCGRTFDELMADPAWRRWNEDRANARTPAGESLADVQQRVWRHIRRAADLHPDGSVVIVSHADVIKTAVAGSIGLPLGSIDRIEVAPASVSTLVVGDWGTKLIALNETLRPPERSQ